MPKLSLDIERTCKVCGRIFRPSTLDSYYCSPPCSKAAYRRKQYEGQQKELLARIKKLCETNTEFVSVKEAVDIYNVNPHSLYRWIRKGLIPHVIVGKKKIRIKKIDLERTLNPKAEPLPSKGPRLYNMEPENCYTIGEIIKKYKVNETSVWEHIRKYSIPTRQIGNFVYAPKEDIDNLYTK